MTASTAQFITITMPLPTPFLTINWRRRQHWRAIARETKAQRAMAAWHTVAALAAANWPPMYPGAVRIDVGVFPYPRQQRPDTTAIWEALKPIIDGLEDAGLVQDDKQVTPGAITWSPERRGELLLTCTREDDS